MRIVLLGAPGSGKGTQGAFLCEQYRIPRIATGDLLREAIAKNDEKANALKAILASGGLVPDPIILEMVAKKLEEPRFHQGCLFDGFPRTLNQAKAMLAQRIHIDFVISIEVPDDMIIDRLSGRLIHLSSGRAYHPEFNPPKLSGKDDITGEPLEKRFDDNEQTVRHRLLQYHEQTKPLVTWYQDVAKNEPNLKFFSISGVGKVETIKDHILNAITSL